MHFSSLFLAALGAVAVSARPGTCPGPKPNREFGVIAIHSGSAVHLSPLSAARRGISARQPNQNAQCERPNEKFATFYIENGALFLYTPKTAEKQQIFVDRSGMGMGVMGYLNGNSPPPRYAELTGWSINADNHLQFAGNDFTACPSTAGESWSIWAAGVQNPGHNQNCIGIVARVEYTQNPNACVYSTE